MRTKGEWDAITTKRLDYIGEQGKVTLAEFAEHFGLPLSTANSWMRQQVNVTGLVTRGEDHTYKLVTRNYRIKSPTLKELRHESIGS